MRQDPRYDPADPEDILRYARRLRGMSVGGIAELSGARDLVKEASAARRKGQVGHVVQAFFGLRPDNRAEADFPEAGLELKILPLTRGKRGISVKERTVVGLIDYGSLATETWQDASLRKKLEQILFVFYEFDAEHLERSKILDVLLWRPDETDLQVFRRDWERIQRYVLEGRAHELSERATLALGACTKGEGGDKDLVGQPFSTTPAKRRAFSLKPAFTQQLVEERVLGRAFESIEAPPLDLHAEFLRRLEPYVGRTLEDIALELFHNVGAGKSSAAAIVKKAVGFQQTDSRIREFEKLNIQMKTLFLAPDSHQPYEAMSFPWMPLRELAEEEFETSTFASQIERLLLVPTYAPIRKAPQEKRTFGRPFFWSPSESEWATIEAEWTRYRDLVREGKASYRETVASTGRTVRANELPGESETQIIHMRPHARNAADTDLDPKWNQVTKQCFWLNKRFLQRIVAEAASGGAHGPDT